LSDSRPTTAKANPIQRSENKTGLPDQLKSGMESISGLSLSDVKVHRNSDKPAQLQAHAYAQGTDIHLGPGTRSRKSLFPKGSTCVVTIGSIGKKMTQASSDCFVNQAVNAIIPNDNYNNDFVYYLSKNNLDSVKGSDSGTSSGRENPS